MAFVVRRCRELYNAALQERRDAWQKCGVSVHVAHQSAELPAIKEARPEYHDVHSQVLQDVLTRLDRPPSLLPPRRAGISQAIPASRKVAGITPSPTSSLATERRSTLGFWCLPKSGGWACAGPALSKARRRP